MAVSAEIPRRSRTTSLILAVDAQCLRQRVGTHAKRLQEILPKYLARVNRPHSILKHPRCRFRREFLRNSSGTIDTWTSPTSQSLPLAPAVPVVMTND